MEKGSSSSATTAGKSKVIGIPTACWCGSDVVPMVSKSDRNPGRRYYRCLFAVTEKQFGDNHIFKWTEEALVEEVESLRNSVDRVENVMLEELESLVMGKVEELVEHLVAKKLDKMVKEKLDKLVGEQLEKLAMEKVQEEIMCMKL